MPLFAQQPPAAFVDVSVVSTDSERVLQHQTPRSSTGQDAGTVGVGKQADLLLLDGNLLTDVGYTAGAAGVMVRGHRLSCSEIDARLDSLATYRDVHLRQQRGRMWRHAGRLNETRAPRLPPSGVQARPRSPRSP